MCRRKTSLRDRTQLVGRCLDGVDVQDLAKRLAVTYDARRRLKGRDEPRDEGAGLGDETPVVIAQAVPFNQCEFMSFASCSFISSI